MALIKNRNAERVTKDAVVLDLGDLHRQGEQIIANARREADRVIEEARAEARRLTEGAAEQGRKQGYEQGIEEGRRQGQDEGRREVIEQFQPHLEQLTASWAEALERWEKERNDLLLAAREDVVRFAFDLARKIVFRMIDADPSVIEDQLAEALSMLSRPSAVTITVHPDDRPTIEEVLPRLLEAVQHCEHAQVRDDPAITRGGCVVTTAGGSIDARIGTQLDRIAEALLPRNEPSAREAPPGIETPADDTEAPKTDEEPGRS